MTSWLYPPAAAHLASMALIYDDSAPILRRRHRRLLAQLVADRRERRRLWRALCAVQPLIAVALLDNDIATAEADLPDRPELPDGTRVTVTVSADGLMRLS